MGTDFLYARPSFLEGAARIADLGNALSVYNYSRSDSQADARALRADWIAVGNDLRAALKQLREEAGLAPAK